MKSVLILSVLYLTPATLMAVDQISVYRLNERYSPTTIVDQVPHKMKFLRSPVDKKVDEVIVTSMTIKPREGERYSKKSIKFQKYPIFGRRAQPRVSFDRQSLELPRSVEHPKLDFLSRIFNTEKSGRKRFD